MARWYTFDDISQELDIPKKTIYLYHERGDGPHVHKFGKHLRVLEVDFYNWQKSQELPKTMSSNQGGTNIGEQK